MPKRGWMYSIKDEEDDEEDRRACGCTDLDRVAVRSPSSARSASATAGVQRTVSRMTCQSHRTATPRHRSRSSRQHLGGI